MADYFIVNGHADHITFIPSKPDDIEAAKTYYEKYPVEEGKDIIVYEVIKTATLRSKRPLTIEQVDIPF